MSASQTALKIPKHKNLPDFCIGFEEEFLDYSILNIIESKIRKEGYTIAFNYPYSSSIIPNKYFNAEDSRVKSIMIEINKRIYLDSNSTKNSNYDSIKKLIQDIIKCIISQCKVE